MKGPGPTAIVGPGIGAVTAIELLSQQYISMHNHIPQKLIRGAGVHMGAGAYSCGAGAYISYSSVGQESTSGAGEYNSVGQERTFLYIFIGCPTVQLRTPDFIQLPHPQY